MAPRIPSNSSAVQRIERSNIRHRSGAHSPNPGASDSQNGASISSRRRISSSHRPERVDETPTTVPADDADGATGGPPTVLLVRRSRISTRSTASRFRTRLRPPPEAEASDYFVQSHDNISSRPAPEREEAAARIGQRQFGYMPRAGDRKYGADAGSGFTHVPLTPPRPAQPDRGRSGWSTYGAQTEDSRLPTPNYPGAGAGAGGLSSYFPRLPALPINFYAFRSRPVLPTVARTESECSTYSQVSTTSSAGSHSAASASSRSTSETHRDRIPTAIKDKRPLLLSAWSSSDKYTRKFPRPRALQGGSWLGSAAASTLASEGGEDGLGLDRPERWTAHKWCLVLSVCTVLVYGGAGLICSVLTWFRAWDGADVFYVANYDLLVLLTLASSILLLAFLVGVSGALLNSRPLLALYALLLWPAFLALLTVAYPSYKRSAYALDRKLSLAWSQYYTPLGRLAIQNALRCCGFRSALHGASPSALCYPRTPLPGCKGPLWRFERRWLATLWRTLFALVPLHILNIFVALLCANHVTRTFGKGIMPKRYRLNADDVHADAGVFLDALREAKVLPVAPPGMTRAPSSRVFREDKKVGYDAEEWETVELLGARRSGWRGG